MRLQKNKKHFTDKFYYFHITPENASKIGLGVTVHLSNSSHLIDSQPFDHVARINKGTIIDKPNI